MVLFKFPGVVGCIVPGIVPLGVIGVGAGLLLGLMPLLSGTLVGVRLLFVVPLVGGTPKGACGASVGVEVEGKPGLSLFGGLVGL